MCFYRSLIRIDGEGGGGGRQEVIDLSKTAQVGYRWCVLGWSGKESNHGKGLVVATGGPIGGVPREPRCPSCS